MQHFKKEAPAEETQAFENNEKKVGEITGTVSRPDQPEVPLQ
jgi:hypothetical protein